MRKLIVLAIILFVNSVSYSLSSYVSVSAIDRYFEKVFNDNSSSLLKESVSLYEEFGDIEISLSSDVFLRISLPQRFLIPDKFFLTLKGSYSISDFCFEIGSYLKETKNLACEVYGNFSYNFAPVEFISITPTLSYFYDFNGWYFEFKLYPSVFLPLNPVISVSVPISFSGLSHGYSSVSQNTLGGVMVSPRVSVFFETFDFIIEGGYFFSLSDMFLSYPYILLKVGKEFK